MFVYVCYRHQDEQFSESSSSSVDNFNFSGVT